MGKHFKEEAKSKPVENSNDNNFYGRIITRQGEGLVEAQKQIKQLEDRLVQERMDRIEDLRNIKAFATCNTYNNEKAFLHKIAEMATDKIQELTSINKKELSSHTGQSI